MLLILLCHLERMIIQFPISGLLSVQKQTDTVGPTITGSVCSPRLLNVDSQISNFLFDMALCHSIKLCKLSFRNPFCFPLRKERLRNLCSYLGHYFPVSWVCYCILGCPSSPASQTGCSSQAEETWHLLLRQSI